MISGDTLKYQNQRNEKFGITFLFIVIFIQENMFRFPQKSMGKLTHSFFFLIIHRLLKGQL